MGVKLSDDISSERTHQIYSPKFMYNIREGLYQKCELWNFEMLVFVFVVVLFLDI